MQPASPIPMQQHAIPSEGLALTWDSVPGTIRYAFIVGMAAAPTPPVEAIIAGKAPGFALLGIPARFTGAAIIVDRPIEPRQYGLLAYMADGRTAPVPNVEYVPARRAPRDRQYHPLMSPALTGAAPEPRPSGAEARAREAERRPEPLTPLRGGADVEQQGWPAASPDSTSRPAPAGIPGAGGPELAMQQQRIGRDGVAVLWDAVAGAIRYGLVIGLPGTTPPPLEAIMRGGSGQFSVAGIPPRYTGAAIAGAASDEMRQVCLIAWLQDGKMAPVPNVRFVPTRAAPRDRDYHSLTPPGLQAPGPAAQASPYTAPSVSPAGADPTARRQSAAEAFAAMMAARQAGHTPEAAISPSAPAAPAPQVPATAPAARAADPWDLLTSPQEEPEPVRWTPPPQPRDDPSPVATQPSWAAPDPWEVLGPPGSADAVEEEEEPEEPRAHHTLPDPWDLLNEPIRAPAAARSQEAPAADVLEAGSPAAPSINLAPVPPVMEHVPPPAAPLAAGVPSAQAAPTLAAPHPDRASSKAADAPVAREGSESTEDAPPQEIVARESSAAASAGGTPHPEEEEGSARREEPAPAAMPAQMAGVQDEAGEPAYPVAYGVAATDRVADQDELESRADERDHSRSPAQGRHMGEPERPEPADVAIGGAGTAVPEAVAPVVDDAAATAAQPTEHGAEVATAPDAHPAATADMTLEPAPSAAPETRDGVEPPREEVSPAAGPVGQVAEAPAADVQPEPEPPAVTVVPAQEAARLAEPETEPVTPATAGEAAHEEHAGPSPISAGAPREDRETEESSQEAHDAASLRPEDDARRETAEQGIGTEQGAAAPPSGEVAIAASADEPTLRAVPPMPMERQAPAGDTQPQVTVASAPAAEAAVPALHDEGGAPVDEAPARAQFHAHPSGPPGDGSAVTEERRVPPEPGLSPGGVAAAAPMPAEQRSDAGSMPAERAPAPHEPEIQPAIALEDQEPVPASTGQVRHGAPPETPPETPTHTPIVPAPPLPVAAAESTTPIEPVEDWPLEERASVAGGPTTTRQGPADHTTQPDQDLRTRSDEALPAQTVPEPQPALAVSSDDVWLIEAEAEPSLPAAVPVVRPGAPDRGPELPSASPPSLSHEPLPSSLVALLEEAELYLLPQWADYGEVARLLNQVEQAAPNHARVFELRQRLQGTQQAASDDIRPFLVEAEECVRHGDFWDAVDLFEKALARRPDDTEARRGRDRAQLLARWPAQLASAGSDATRLAAIGDEYAALAPALAEQAYERAFAASPSPSLLARLLMSMARESEPSKLVETARQGIETLRQLELVVATDRVHSALEALGHWAAHGATGAGAEQLLIELTAAITAGAS